LAQLEVIAAAVAAQGAQVAAAAPSTVGDGPVRPAAADPVSVGAAQSLSVWKAVIAAYSAAAGEITQLRGAMLQASGTAYAEQEAANRGGLTVGAAFPTLVGAAPAPAPVPPMAPAVIPAPVIGPPPGDAKTLATLFDDGDPTGLYTAEQQLKQQATTLRTTAADLIARAVSIEGDWRSDAGTTAATRLRELGTWYDSHADQATAAAAACARAADNFGRAKAAVPTLAQLDDIDRRIDHVNAAMAANPRFAVLYQPLMTELQTQRADLHRQAYTGYAGYQTSTEASTLTGNPVEPPPGPRAGVYAPDNAAAQPVGLLGHIPAPDKHLIYCYPQAGPDQWLCEGFDDKTGGSYTFPSPIDVSGVAD
jgi:hypothetical protein